MKLTPAQIEAASHLLAVERGRIGGLNGSKEAKRRAALKSWSKAAREKRKSLKLARKSFTRPKKSSLATTCKTTVSAGS